MDLKNLFKKKKKTTEITSDDNSVSLSYMTESKEDNFFQNLKSKNNIKHKVIEEPQTVTSLENLNVKPKKSIFSFNKGQTSNLENELILYEKTKGSKSKSSDLDANARFKKLPIIGSIPLSRQYQFVGALIVLSIGLIAYGSYQYFEGKNDLAQSQQNLLLIKDRLQKFDNNFSSAVVGKQGSYDATNTSYKELVKIIEDSRNKTKNFDDNQNNAIVAIESSMDKSLSEINKNLNKLSQQEYFLRNTSSRITSLNNNINNLSDTVDRLGMVYYQIGANQPELANIYYLRSLLNSISSNTSSLLLSDIPNIDTAVNLKKSRDGFRKALNDIYYGNATKSIRPLDLNIPFSTYNTLVTNWVKFAFDVDYLYQKSQDLYSIKNLAPKNTELINNLDKNIDSLLSIHQNNDFSKTNMARTIIILGVLFFVMATILLFYIYTIERENRALMDKIENNKNQSSILRLLNEMVPLQDGDLTAQATVSDDITGAIADAINATVTSLGSLVKRIKDSSFTMNQKTLQMSSISTNMLRSNQEQSSSIQDAAKSVQKIADAMRDIAEKTQQTAATAQTSALISQNGAEQVLQSVKSMNSINEKMEETDRLMVKVLDSSKQITEIVELLSDITEETNILALNATVQAAKAGEAGKGFKIVADSIQKLADDASDATRRVGALIAAVQTDIQAVGDSVDKSKEEVNNGVKLSESAGDSLNKIREISNKLSNIVSTVSDEANNYAQDSEIVKQNIDKILDTTAIAKDSTEKTAHSIRDIADMSKELGDSVQSFKVE